MKDDFEMEEAENLGGNLNMAVKKVILAEWCLICCLMGMTGESINKEIKDDSSEAKDDTSEANEESQLAEEASMTGKLIWLFLNFLHKHETSIGKKKHIWLSCCNFMHLLNLPG